MTILLIPYILKHCLLRIDKKVLETLVGKSLFHKARFLARFLHSKEVIIDYNKIC